MEVPKKRRITCDVPDGFEIRGMKFKIYPTPEQALALEAIQAQSRYIWNTIVRDWRSTQRARECWAVKNGIVEPFNKEWDDDTKKERQSKIYEASKSVEGLKLRSLKDWLAHFETKQDYQFFQRILSWREWPENTMKLNAAVLQGLGRSFFSKGVKRVRKFDSEMPIRIRTGRNCFKVGDFGTRRDKPFYNCQVAVNGLKIRGRLPGRAPSGRVLEGVAITKLADGWYAAIREVVPIRERPPATPGLKVGIDVGLIDLAAFSDGYVVSNSRGREFAERIAGRQAEGKDVGRLHLRARRHLDQQCYEIAKSLQKHELVAMERLCDDIGQRGSNKVSAMRKLKTIIASRVGDRLREVNPQRTSQTCSQCGFLSKESWSWRSGRRGKCPSCGYSEHRDVNAARNILRKAEEPLGSS